MINQIVDNWKSVCFPNWLIGLTRYKYNYTKTDGWPKGPSTKDVRQMGRGGGFEISDIPGRGEGVVCESSDVRKFLKKSKFQNLKLKL